MDRLSDSVGEQECILWILDRTGVKLQAVTGSPTNDPFSDAIRKAFAAIHLYQTALTSVKENPGLLLKSLHGKWTGGTPPFGYKAENGELVIEEYEAKMVRYIFFLHSHYPMNTRQIGAHIEVNKVMTDVCKYTTRKVFKILAHERLYRGEYRDCYGVVHPRPDLKILPDTKDELKALHIKDPADEHQINA
jgi:site-specific DNA recombinase